MRRIRKCSKCGGELVVHKNFTMHGAPFATKCKVCGDIEKHNDINDLYEYGDEAPFMELSDGNPGAMRFIVDAYRTSPVKADRVFRRMFYHGIVGAKLYMLWNDCCDCDTDLALAVADTNTVSELLRHINYEHGRGIPFVDGKANNV